MVARRSGANVGIQYELTIAYPAAELLEHIRRQLTAEWTPRDEDLLNPGIPTSHVRGWTQHGDMTTSPPSWVHSWSAEWQNATSDILSYDLHYRYPTVGLERPSTEAPQTTRLSVTATVLTSNQVRRMVKAVRAFQR